MKARASLLMLLFVVCAAACARADAVAVLGKVNGKVLVKTADNPLWTPAASGDELKSGDSIRTGSGSSAILNFPDGGYMKILPMSDVTVGETTAPDGSPCPVAAITGGRAWTRIDLKDDKGDGQFIILTENAAFNGKDATAFIEAQTDKKLSCLDVFDGALTVRSRSSATESPVTLLAHQRAMAGDDGLMPADTQTGGFNENASFYTCMTSTAAPAAASDTTDTGDTQTTSDQASTQPEISEDDTISFGAETPKPETTAATTGQGGTTSETTSAPAVEEEEYEYETIEISVSASVSVTSAGAAAACKDKPVIGDVFISGQVAASAETLTLKSTSKCGPVAKPVITWTSSIKCGQISSSSITTGGAVTRLPGAAPKETALGKYTFEITDSTTRNIVIKALGSNGLESQYTFSVNVPEPTDIPAPSITELLINSEIYKTGQVINISSDECEPQQFYIEGKAKSDCGDIVLTQITAHEAPLTVTGTDEFSALLQIKETQTVPVSILVKDSTGARNKPFLVTIDFAKQEMPPSVSIDTVAGNLVSAGLGEPIDVYRNDLTGGKLIITGGASSDRCVIKKVEASLDNGSTWGKADGSNSWSYSFIPREGDYQAVARSFDIDETTSDDMFQPVEIIYYPKTREEILQEAFDTLLRAYQDKDAVTFVNGTASNYSTRYDSVEDRGRLDTALNGKFTDISSVYLRYRVQTVIVSGKSGRVTFLWDANPNTTSYSKTGTFVFQKERDGWKLITVEDDKTFLRYTTQADLVEISTRDTSLVANNIDTTKVTVNVYDSAGNAVKNGTTILFTATTGDLSSSTTTTDGTAELTYTASDTIGGVTITASSGHASASTSLTLTREFAPAPPPAP